MSDYESNENTLTKTCPDCGEKMELRIGKYSRFWCTGCKRSESLTTMKEKPHEDEIMDDNVTIEPCPKCKTDAHCVHGKRDSHSFVHIWSCPTCGVDIVSVVYSCVQCITASLGSLPDTFLKIRFMV